MVCKKHLKTELKLREGSRLKSLILMISILMLPSCPIAWKTSRDVTMVKLNILFQHSCFCYSYYFRLLAMIDLYFFFLLFIKSFVFACVYILQTNLRVKKMDMDKAEITPLLNILFLKLTPKSVHFGIVYGWGV